MKLLIEKGGTEMKRIKRIIAALIAAMLVLSASPLNALAEAVEKIPSENDIFNAEMLNGMEDEYYWEQFDLNGEHSYTIDGVDYTIIWNWDADTKTLYVDTADWGGIFTYFFDNYLYEKYYVFSEEELENDPSIDVDGCWCDLPFMGYYMEHLVFGKHIETIKGNIRYFDTLRDITFESGSRFKSFNSYFECHSSAKPIIDITFPNTLKTIGNGAFKGMKLNNVVLPASVETIASQCFRDAQINNLDLSQTGVSKITVNCFLNTQVKQNMLLPQGVQELEHNAFDGLKCNNLTVPSTVETIGDGCFKNTQIKRLDLTGVEITKIPDYFFSGMSGIETLLLSQGYKEIGENAFEGYSCDTFVVPSTVEALGDACFKNAQIRILDLSRTEITEIPSYCFSEMTGVERIILPSTVKTIGDAAFKKAEVETLVITSGVEEIGTDCFSGAKLQNGLDLRGTDIIDIPSYAFAYSDTGGTVQLPAGVERIGQYAFRGAKITSIFIPSSVLTLDSYAFCVCTELQSIDISATNVKTLDNVFYGCTSLTELRLPESLKTLRSAVMGCSSLRTLELPEGVEEISGLPSGLKTITFPSSLIKIDNLRSLGMAEVDFSGNKGGLTLGASVFEDNKALTKITLPKSNFNQLDVYSFRGCSNLSSVKLYGCKEIGKEAFSGTAIESIDIPDNCTTVYDGAFKNCAELETVRLSKKLKIISSSSWSKGADPFSGCENLKTVIFPSKEDFNNASSTNRNNNTEEKVFTLFSDAGFLMQDGLTVYLYPNTRIERYCETYGINYEYINWDVEDILPETEPDEPVEITFTKEGTFEHGKWYITSNLEAPLAWYRKAGLVLEFEEDCTVIGRTLTCSSGYETTIEELLNKYHFNHIFFTGDGKIKIGDEYMYGFSAFTTDYFGVTLDKNVYAVGENAFRSSNINSLWLEATVKDAGKYAFADNKNLTNVHFSEGMTEIKEGVFYNTRIIHSSFNVATQVTIPDTVTKIGKKAFAAYNSTSNSGTYVTFHLENYDVEIYEDPEKPWENAIGVTADGYNDKYITLLVDKDTSSYRYAKDYGIKYEMRVGEETEEEANAAPKYDLSVPTVITPDPEGDNNIIQGILAEKGNAPKANSSDTWTYRYDTKTMILQTRSNNITSINYCKLYYKNLEEVNEGDFEIDYLVLVGGFNALFGSDYSSSVITPLSFFNPKYIDFSGVIMKGFYNGAFENCTRLESLTIPADVTLGRNLFENTPSLKGVEFKNRDNIRSDLLSGKKSLRFVKLPENINSISAKAFAYCTNLQQIVIPDSCVSIGLKAFYNCVNVQSVTLGKNLNQISKDAFSGLAYCEKLVINSPRLRIDEAVTGIDLKEQFANLGVMTNGITVEYGGDIFVADFRLADGKNITKIKLGKNVSELNGIQYLENLEEIEIDEENGVFTLENGILYKGNELVLAPCRLEQITVKANTEKIGDYAFYKTRAKTVKLPNSVSEIGQMSFAESEYLKSVTMNRGVLSIGTGAFKNCIRLRTVLMPSGLKTIGRCAFEGCTTLASVILDEQLEMINEDAFRGCEALRGMVIPQSVSVIKSGAFENCSTLEYAYIWDSSVEEYAFDGDEVLEIFTILASNPYEYAKLHNIKVTAYTDGDAFFTEAALKLDVEAGYVGYCNGEHGDIEWLTVYEADCENDGYMIGVCEYCSELLEERHIDAYGHDYRKVYETAPTESVRGGALYTCNRCHTSKYEYSDEAAPSGQIISTQMVLGRVIIADNKNAVTGRSPARRAWIMNGESKLAETDENGNFSLTLESGVYYLKVHYAFGFDRYVTVVVENEDVDCGNIAVVGADFNKDGKINEEDTKLFRIVLSAVKNDPSYLEYVDLNNDGTINAKDLVILKAFSGLNASEFEYGELLFKSATQ